MAGIDYPLWYTLKANVKTALEAIATEEAALDAGRNFIVNADKWRPWIEAQQSVALANILVPRVDQASDRSGSRKSSIDEVSLTVDMYAIGQAGETLPCDEVAAKRLDLLVSQVREGLTRLAGQDFNMTSDGQLLIDRSVNLSLQYYDQEIEQSTGQYAPARWTLTVYMPHIPYDDNTLVNLSELNTQVKEDDLNIFAVKFEY